MFTLCYVKLISKSLISQFIFTKNRKLQGPSKISQALQIRSHHRLIIDHILFQLPAVWLITGLERLVTGHRDKAKVSTSIIEASVVQHNIEIGSYLSVV